MPKTSANKLAYIAQWQEKNQERVNQYKKSYDDRKCARLRLETEKKRNFRNTFRELCQMSRAMKVN